MNRSEVRLAQGDEGLWVVHCPGGDKYSFPRLAQAETFANGFCVLFDERASVGAIQTALTMLREHEMNLELGRRLRSKLQTASMNEKFY